MARASGFITHVVLFAGYLPPSTDVLSAERIAQQRRQPAETEISQVFQTTAGRHVQVSQLISMLPLPIHCTNLKMLASNSGTTNPPPTILFNINSSFI